VKAGTPRSWCRPAAGAGRRDDAAHHGLLGHSDADALLHAITDAVLGAAGLGDIGRALSRHRPGLRGADSMRLLQAEAGAARARDRLPLVNIDSTIVAQAPKLAPHIPAMRERIAAALGLDARPST
jgi:2-C-methyl-D-erythritol 2,4-cyclodiphosphate synthase